MTPGTRPLQLVGTVRAVGAAQTVFGTAVNVLVIETTADLAGLAPGQIHRVQMRRAKRRLILPAPRGRACGLRKNRIHD